jgi:hypothetical protein
MSKPNLSFRALLILFVITAFTIASSRPGRAQNAAPPIVLDDATPSIDAVITPANGAAGVVLLELEGARVQLSTAANVEILSIADARVQSFAFQFATGAAPHVLRLERLPGVAVARANILPQSVLPAVNAPSSTTPLTTLSNPVSGITTAAPAASLPVVASAGANLFTAQVAAESTIQLTDSTGGVLFTMQASRAGIPAIAARLAPGLYLANFVNKDTNARNDVTVALSNAPELTMATVAPVATGSQIAIVTRRPTQQATARATVRATARATARATEDDDDDDDNSGRGGGGDDDDNSGGDDDNSGRGGGGDDNDKD